jgi:hypothetical protein
LEKEVIGRYLGARVGDEETEWERPVENIGERCKGSRRRREVEKQ